MVESDANISNTAFNLFNKKERDTGYSEIDRSLGSWK